MKEIRKNCEKLKQKTNKNDLKKIDFISDFDSKNNKGKLQSD